MKKKTVRFISNFLKLSLAHSFYHIVGDNVKCTILTIWRNEDIVFEELVTFQISIKHKPTGYHLAEKSVS